MLDRRGGLVTKNYYRRGGVVSRNGHRKNMSRLGFQEGGYAHMPGYSSNPDMIHYLKLLQNEINNYDFSKEADNYHGTFLGTFFGTGKTRNDMLDYVAKQTGKTEAEVIKEDPSWTEPIEDWTKKLLISQVDERIDEIQENPTNQGVVDEAIKKTFEGGTILQFPQKLQDTIINRIGGGYRQQFGVPIDTKMLEGVVGDPKKSGWFLKKDIEKKIQEIKTGYAGTNYTSAEDVGEQDRQSPWSTIADKGLSLLGFGGAHAGIIPASSFMPGVAQGDDKESVITPYTKEDIAEWDSMPTAEVYEPDNKIAKASLLSKVGSGIKDYFNYNPGSGDIPGIIKEYAPIDERLSKQYHNPQNNPDWKQYFAAPEFGEAKGASTTTIASGILGPTPDYIPNWLDKIVAVPQTMAAMVGQAGYQLQDEGFTGKAVADWQEQMQGYVGSRFRRENIKTAEDAWASGKITDAYFNKPFGQRGTNYTVLNRDSIAEGSAVNKKERRKQRIVRAEKERREIEKYEAAQAAIAAAQAAAAEQAAAEQAAAEQAAQAVTVTPPPVNTTLSPVSTTTLPWTPSVASPPPAVTVTPPPPPQEDEYEAVEQAGGSMDDFSDIPAPTPSRPEPSTSNNWGPSSHMI